MKTNKTFKKLPQLIDYVLAVAINSMPGFSETDGQTKVFYQRIAKQLLAHEIRSRHKSVRKNLNILIKYPRNLRSKAA